MAYLCRKNMDIVVCINKIYDLSHLVQSGLLDPKIVTAKIADALDEFKYGKVERSPLEEILVDTDDVIQLYLDNVSVEDFRRHISDIKGYRAIYISNN